MSVTPIITEAMQEYDPYAAEFERGRRVERRESRGEYARGFSDAIMVAFAFGLLGAVIGIALAVIA